MTTTAIAPSLPASSSPADVIFWQGECIRSGAFQILGKIWMIALEAAAGAHVPGKSVADRLGSRIEFYNSLGGPDVIGPRIAQTGPKGNLLILDPFVRDDGTVGLPDIPDPTWAPPIPTEKQLTGIKAYVQPKAPMIPQHFVDHKDGYGGRARGQIRAGSTVYLVCGPVSQMVIRPIDEQNRILPNGLILKALPWNGTQMELLVNPQNGESFLYGGRFEIISPG